MFILLEDLLLVQVFFCMRREFGKLEFPGSLSTEPGLSCPELPCSHLTVWKLISQSSKVAFNVHFRQGIGNGEGVEPIRFRSTNTHSRHCTCLQIFSGLWGHHVCALADVALLFQFSGDYGEKIQSDHPTQCKLASNIQLQTSMDRRSLKSNCWSQTTWETMLPENKRWGLKGLFPKRFQCIF